MNLTCDACKESYVADAQLEERITKARADGVKFLMIKCPLCGRSHPVNPQTLALPPADSARKYRCPTEACIGYAVHVDEDENGGFWGCGECGTVWRTRDDLFSAITAVVKKHQHRKQVYKKTGKDYLPVTPEPADYEEKVLAGRS